MARLKKLTRQRGNYCRDVEDGEEGSWKKLVRRIGEEKRQGSFLGKERTALYNI